MPLALLLFFSLVQDVRTLVAKHDLDAAERAARQYQQQDGSTPEFAAALSWLARGALQEGQLDRAEQYASETRRLSLDLMRGRQLDSDPWLPTALGASIEVQAQVLGARGERADAVGFLNQQLAAYGKTSLAERIRKNINLLSLEGKPAPPLEQKEWLGPKPRPLSALRGHAVLLFFWAHWCPDCKAEAPILASLLKTYGPKGLLVVGPTKLYGYAVRGEDAAPPIEKQHIEEVRRKFYAALPTMPVPISAAGFLAYGSSTTPTLVLVDRDGIIRYYHPGAASEAELSARIQAVLGR
jgi:thiol-disulfide isomerase/thioredoxin